MTALAIFGIIIIYFIPTFIAHWRRLDAEDFWIIAVLNMFVGVTIFGWILALCLAAFLSPAQDRQ